jgi:ketosteroid isomerase-like protein
MAEGVQVVQQAYEAFGRGDIPGLLGVLAEDVDWSVAEAIPHGGRFSGRDEVGRFFQGIGENWEEGFSVEVDETVDGGDQVVTLGTARGTLRDGRGDASYGFAHVFTVRDGHVVRFREYVDPDATLRGLG